MIAPMAILFFFIAIAVLLLGTFGLCVLIAIVAKRPAIAVAGGLAILLLVGLAISLLLVTRTVVHSPPSALITPGMNTYPDVHIPPPDAIVPQITPIDGERTTHFRFTAFAIFPLLVIAAVIGLIVALFSRSNQGSRGRWWPALAVLIPMGALACFALMFGWEKSHRVHAPATEPVVQDWSPFIDSRAAVHTEVERARREMERAVATQKRARKKAEQARDESMRHAAELTAKLQRQFATMDINQLIDIFQAPKIELAENAEQPLPPDGAIAPPTADVEAPALPAAPEVPTAALPPADGASPIAPEDPASAPAEDPSAAAAQTAITSAEAESSDHQPVLVESPSENAKSVSEPNPPPDWVHDAPGQHDNAWSEVIETDEYATVDECRRATDVYMMMKTADRARTLAHQPFFKSNRPSLTFNRGIIMADGLVIFDGVPRDDRLQLLNKMGIGIDHVRRSVLGGKQSLTSRHSPRSFGPMYKEYTQITFTPEFDSELRRAWNNLQRVARFEMVVTGAGSVLGLLGFVFGLLKIDTWTKGYYSKRLFIGVPAAIIGFVFILMVWNEVHF